MAYTFTNIVSHSLNIENINLPGYH